MIPKDQTEVLIKQTYAGMPKTCEKMIEQHRREATQTEREIGWDKATRTTQKQRDQLNQQNKRTAEERRYENLRRQ